MKNQRTKTIVTTIILIMAVVQAPLFYYYSSDLGGILIEVPYSLIGLGLTIALLNSLFKHATTNTRYHIIGLIVTILIAFPTRFRRDTIEYLDWKLQFNRRSRIVEQVKAGNLKSGEDGRCKLNDNSFLPLSTAGNKILVIHDKAGILEVEFYVESGSLDHYSALVYTDRKLDISEKDNNTVTTLDAHWYAVHF